MPIKGLSDRKLSFPSIGTIRKGAPKDEKGQLGKDLTYFRTEFDEQETVATQTFLKKYGAEPREINILLPFDDIDRCWENWLEAYTAGRMVARSDGEKFIYLVDTKTGEIKVKDGSPHTPYRDGQIVGTYTDGRGQIQNIVCKPVGRLKVVIPELQRLAYMTVMTTSVHDIANISAQLEALKTVNGGRLAGIPMVLRRRPKKISTPKSDGTRARYTKWMISIEADPAWVKAKLMEVKQAALPGNGLELLNAGDEVVEADQVEIAPEIYEDEPDEDFPSDPEMVEAEQHKALSRPLSPEDLKNALAKKAEGYKGDKASPGKRGLVVNVFEKCFAGQASDLKRHEVSKFLTGEASSKNWSDGYVLALFDLFKPTNDSGGDPLPDAMAEREILAVLNHIENTKEGQERLI